MCVCWPLQADFYAALSASPKHPAPQPPTLAHLLYYMTCRASSDELITLDHVTFLHAFFKRHPDLHGRQLYLAGESYAGGEWEGTAPALSGLSLLRLGHQRGVGGDRPSVLNLRLGHEGGRAMQVGRGRRMHVSTLGLLRPKRRRGGTTETGVRKHEVGIVSCVGSGSTGTCPGLGLENMRQRYSCSCHGLLLDWDLVLSLSLHAKSADSVMWVCTCRSLPAHARGQAFG